MNSIVKRAFLAIIACCFIATTSFGQAPAAGRPDVPEMTFEKLEHDFGKVALNDTAKFEFKFTNTGSRPVVVQNCSVGCGCTVSSCPAGSDQILPGQSRVITMMYTRTSYEHQFNQAATIISTAHNSPIRLTIRGQVARDTQTANN